MEVHDLPVTSLVDFPGRVAFGVFTPKCSFGCPTCHSAELSKVEEGKGSKEIFKFLKEYDNLDWYDGFFISGGEPTLQPDLPEFCGRIKRETGLAVKVDTNGSRPDVLERLLAECNVDYVAVDVKGPNELYAQLVGREDVDLDAIEKSFVLATRFPDYEFRTTVVPLIDNGEYRWLSLEDASDMVGMLRNLEINPNSKWYIQKFVSREKGIILDDRFCKDELPQEFHETPRSYLEEFAEVVGKYFGNAGVR